MNKIINKTPKFEMDKASIKQSQIARFERVAHSPQINSLLKTLYPLGYTLKLEKI